MNLGHHLRVRLQAFASYCMTHAEIKETKKEAKEDEKEKSHNQKFTQKGVSTGKRDFVKPEEHAHNSHQRHDIFRHQASRTESRQCTVV